MDTEGIIELMAGRQLFEGASPDVLRDLVTHGTVESINQGESMIEQGKIGEAVWVLVEGKVQIVVDGIEQHELDTPGTILGEISAVSHTAATATVNANSEVTALKISHQDFHKALASSEKLATSVLRSLAKYL